jgi:hypothetical protein
MRLARPCVGAVPARPAGASVDWRLEPAASLVAQVSLGDEWDAEGPLVVPRPGGLLAPGTACRAPGCPNVRHQGGSLCQSHKQGFTGSGQASLEEWPVSDDISDEPGVTRPRF